LEYRTIARYPDYEVNRDGEIRRKATGHILKPVDTVSGHPRVKIDGRLEYISRLVAETYLMGSDLPYVMHRDHDPSNNSVRNLIWASRGDIHRSFYGLGADSPGGAEPPKPVRIIETEEIFPSIRSCARAIGGTASGIREQLNGRIETYKGYHFELVDIF